MYNHLGYEKYSNQGDHSGNSRNDSYKKLTQTEMGGSVFKEWRGKINAFTAGFPYQPFPVGDQRKGSRR